MTERELVCVSFQVGGVVLEGLSSTAHIKNWMKIVMSLPQAAKGTVAKSLLKYYPRQPRRGSKSQRKMRATLLPMTVRLAQGFLGAHKLWLWDASGADCR